MRTELISAPTHFYMQRYAPCAACSAAMQRACRVIIKSLFTFNENQSLIDGEFSKKDNAMVDTRSASLQAASLPQPLERGWACEQPQPTNLALDLAGATNELAKKAFSTASAIAQIPAPPLVASPPPAATPPLIQGQETSESHVQESQAAPIIAPSAEETANLPPSSPSAAPVLKRSASYNALSICPASPPRQVIPKAKLDHVRQGKTIGMTDAVFAPMELCRSINVLTREPHDHEIATENQLAIIEAPFSFAQAVTAIISNVLWIFSKIYEGVDVQKWAWTVVEKVSVIGGLVVCCLEFLYEVIQLKRVVHLLNDTLFTEKASLDKLEALQGLSKEKQLEFISLLIKEMDDNKDKLIEAHGPALFDQLYYTLKSYKIEVAQLENPNFERFESKMLYLQLKSLEKRRLKPSQREIWRIRQNTPSMSEDEATEKALVLKLSRLSRRISPLAVENLQRDLQSVFSDLKSPNEALRLAASARAKQLINNLNIQTRKAIIVHIVALVSFAIMITGLSLALVALFNPFFLPVTLVALPTALFWGGFGVACLKYCFEKGFLTTNGWEFSWYHATRCFVSAYNKVGDYASKAFSWISSIGARLTRKPEERPPLAASRIRSYSF